MTISEPKMMIFKPLFPTIAQIATRLIQNTNEFKRTVSLLSLHKLMIEVVIFNMFLFSLIDFKDLWAFINSVIQFNTNCDTGIHKEKTHFVCFFFW